MQVRVFEATDMASGLKLVKKELGPDALILSTRTVRNGKLGLMGKAMLEITAAIDADYPNKTKQPVQEKSLRQRLPANAKSKTTSGFSHVVDDPVESFLPHTATFRFADDESGENFQSQNATTADCKSLSGNNKDRQVEEAVTAEPQPNLQNEVNELKSLLIHLSGKIAQIVEKEESPKEVRRATIPNSNFHNRFNSTAIHGDHILSMLNERGVNVETSRAIAGSLRESLTDQELGFDGDRPGGDHRHDRASDPDKPAIFCKQGQPAAHCPGWPNRGRQDHNARQDCRIVPEQIRQFSGPYNHRHLPYRRH